MEIQKQVNVIGKILKATESLNEALDLISITDRMDRKEVGDYTQRLTDLYGKLVDMAAELLTITPDEGIEGFTKRTFSIKSKEERERINKELEKEFYPDGR